MRKSAVDRKAEIIDVAISLADKVGPDKITTGMIAKEIGVTQAAIFRHFPKKDDIWNSVAIQLTGKTVEVWNSPVKKGEDAVTRLRHVVIGHLKLIRRVPALPAILFSRELHANNQLLRKTLLGVMGQLQKRLTDLVEEAMTEGQFRDDLIAEDVALLLIGLIQSIALRWSMSARSEDLVATGERLLAVQLSGFITPTVSGQTKASTPS